MRLHNRPPSRLLVTGAVDAEMAVDAEILPCLCISPLTSSPALLHQVLHGNL